MSTPDTDIQIIEPDADPEHVVPKDDTALFFSTLDGEKAMTFFTAERTSDIALDETVAQLIDICELEHIICDVETRAGIAIAKAALRHGAKLQILTTPDSPELPIEQEDPVFDLADPRAELDQAPHLLSQANGYIVADPSRFASIPTRLIALPATVGSGHVLVDMINRASGDTSSDLELNQECNPGRVIEQAQIMERSLHLVDVPERGLVQLPEGVFARRLSLIGAEAGATAKAQARKQAAEDERIAARKETTRKRMEKRAENKRARDAELAEKSSENS